MQNKKDQIKKEDKNAQKINELENKIQEMENNWKRALADYKNLEKRTTQEKISLADFANGILIEQLLPVLDNFEMLVKHNSDQGLGMSVKEFKRVLISAGVQEIEVVENDDFDHETMDAIETTSGEKGKVTEIIRKGFKFKNKLIRPASVKVGNGES